MQSKQYFTKIKNYPHEKSTEPCTVYGNGLYSPLRKAVVIRLMDGYNRKDEHA